MDVFLLNIFLAFIEGFGLIISPCILPILPIILGGSLTGNKSRPLGIIAGFILIFTLFTLFSRVLINATGINPDLLRNISFVILLLLGLIMLSTYLTEKFSMLTQSFARVGTNLQTANNPESGFWGGLIFGGLVGLIWTPCAGPILAAVIVQILTQRSTTNSALIILAFAIGVALPMLLIAMMGRKFVSQSKFFQDHSILFRQILGLIIIASVIFAIYAPSLTLQFSSSGKPTPKIQLTGKELTEGLIMPYPAPAIAGIHLWINSPPLTIEELRGKVVLIDFWTYSCINCIRTLPYLIAWYDKYHDQGFEIIGIHSPEFEFEKKPENVKAAVKNYKIRYPIALDNNFVTWNNFKNRYWPAHYLINKDGLVVYEHFGEGKYDVTENNIRYLLGLSKESLTQESQSLSFTQTPETYLGYARVDNFASKEPIANNQSFTYSYPDYLARHQWALRGKWSIFSEKIVADSKDAAIKLHFKAAKVYAVMGVNNKAIKVVVFLNAKDKNVVKKELLVNRNDLYTLVNLPEQTEAEVELISQDAGLEMYTFTFG